MMGDEEFGTTEGKELLTGEETAKVISRMYEILGPENGCLLVESTAVLAVAGLKGYTFLVDAKIDEQGKVEIEALNKQFEAEGLRIEVWSSNDAVNIFNLKGFAYKTRRTKIPGYLPYDYSTGFEGLRKLWREAFEEVERLKQNREIPTEVDEGIYEQGVMLGYPDQAILDFEKCLRAGDINKDLINSDMMSASPFAEEYGGPVPEFDYYPSSTADPEIVEYIERAKRVLKEFYSSSWHRAVAQNPEFLASRQREKERFQARMYNSASYS